MALVYRVKDWERFQHYRSGRNQQVVPQWIKLYTGLLDDDDFSRLSVFDRHLIVMCWLLAARKNNNLPGDPAWVAGRVDLPVTDVTSGLQRLVAGGWLVAEDDGRGGPVPELYDAPPPPKGRADPDEPLPADDNSPHQQAVRVCHDAWVKRFGGVPPVKTWVKPMALLLKSYTPEQIGLAFAAYLASVEARYVSFPRFSMTVGEWLAESQKVSKLGIDPSKVVGGGG